MVSRVLVAMDGSEMAEQALRYALDVHSGADITVLTVVGEPSALFGEATAIALANDPERAMEEFAQPVLDRAQEIATEYNAEISVDVRAGHPARLILNQADAFDTVVIGSHGGTLARLHAMRPAVYRRDGRRRPATDRRCDVGSGTLGGRQFS